VLETTHLCYMLKQEVLFPLTEPLLLTGSLRGRRTQDLDNDPRLDLEEGRSHHGT
jgi:hypothetical protein